MGSMFHCAYALLLSLTAAYAAVDTWHFEWPSKTTQCQSVEITFTGGVPPWEVDVLPIGGQPIYWTVSDPKRPVNGSYPWVATIPLQLEAGTWYTVVVLDANGFNTAPHNPIGIQQVGNSSDASCIQVAAPAKKDFDFQVYGSANACQSSFGVTWTTSIRAWPYWCTIVPLDETYNPWTVTLADENSTASSANWKVNMTSGTRFTIVMHDTYGVGRGGVGQIWEVESSGDNSCATQQWMGRADWPPRLQINTIPSTATAWGSEPTNTSAVSSSDTQTASNTSTAHPSSSSSISSGAIAGIAVGAAAGSLAVAAALFFFIRRCLGRRREALEVTPSMDLLGIHTANVEPKVDPYRPVNQQGHPPTMGYGVAGYDSNQMSAPGQPWSEGGMSDSPRSSTTFLPMGAAVSGTTSLNRPTSQYTTTGSVNATPLAFATTALQAPTQSNNSAPLSSLSTDVKTVFAPTTSQAHGASVGGATGEGLADMVETAETTTAVAAPLAPEIHRASSPEYRQHVGGGRVTSEDATLPDRQVVDLPPLYSDVAQSDNEGVAQEQGQGGPGQQTRMI